jgi:two-component system sensor histidine kinase DesK
VEIERAKSTLETAGVAVEYHSTRVGITPAQESVLALALREAITNVVRHAQAKTCRLQLLQVNGVCRLEIQDDGRGGLHAEGDGLRGMRERIEALGGSLLQDAHAISLYTSFTAKIWRMSLKHHRLSRDYKNGIRFWSSNI